MATSSASSASRSARSRSASYSARGSTTNSSPLGVRMICGALIALAPLVSGRGPAAYIDCQDCGCILIENHPVAANAEAVAIAALKGLHVALARHSVSVKPSFHLLTSVPGKDIDIFRRAQREHDRFHERYYRSMLPVRQAIISLIFLF